MNRRKSAGRWDVPEDGSVYAQLGAGLILPS